MRTFVRCIILYVLALISNLESFAQSGKFIPIAPELLSSSFVRCFKKDSFGFMWIGTNDGLYRYDGTNSFRYEHNPQNATSICHNYINAIVEDRKSRLWIGTAQGLSIYDRNKDEFINVDSIAANVNHLNNRYITALEIDPAGRIWVGTHGNGINIYDESKAAFTYLADTPQGKIAPASNYINTIVQIDDQMWCGTKRGLRVFDIASSKMQLPQIIGDSPSDNQVTQMVADRLGSIWLSTTHGDIIKLIPGNGYYTGKTIIHARSMFGTSWTNALSLSLDLKGNLWIAGENSGANYLDVNTGKVTRFLSETTGGKLPTNSIRNVYVDNTGLIWIGTFTSGAFLLDHQKGKFNRTRNEQSVLAGKTIKSFAEDRDGNIWVATEGIGLSKMNLKDRKVEVLKSLNNRLDNVFISDIIFDRDGNLWVGTIGKGIYRINLRKNEVVNFPAKSQGFGDDKIYSLYEDKSGVIWAGTYGSGAFYFDKKSQKFQNLLEDHKTHYITRTSYVTSFLDDSEGTLWVGTMYGLFALRRTGPDSFDYQSYLPDKQPGSISSAGIQTLTEDRKKNLWIGTTDNGLNVKYKGEDAFHVFRKEHGMASNTVRAIQPDANGNLWIGSNSGLTKFEIEENKFINYTREDGLASNDIQQNASLKSSAGELLFGGNNGMNVFSPDSVYADTLRPIVYLSDLKINNQSVKIGPPGSTLETHISLASGITLPYEERSFRIDFVAFNLGQSSRHNYCYKLEGFDKDWNCIGSGLSATYTNISPGDYTFLVKASNRDGVWSVRPTSLKITIRPLIWTTWWAISIYAIVVACVAAFIIKVQIDRMNMKSQLEMERLAHEKEHALIESKTQFFTNISHEFRTPLSLILMPLDHLMASDKIDGSIRERVITAHKSADKMMRLVNELMDFNKLESATLKLDLQHGELVQFISDIANIFHDAARKNSIQFSIKAEVDHIHGWFDKDKLEKIVANVLSNAFKFTLRHGNIRVIINQKYTITPHSPNLCRCLELIVIDDGIGIPAEELPRIFDKFYQAKSAAKVSNPGTGIGLALTKGLVELHHGYIKAESYPEETRFTISIPIDADFHGVGQVAQESPGNSTTPGEPDTPSTNEKSEQPQESENPEILIVEDNDELRTYLCRELRREFRVIEASDGMEGLQLAIDRCPGLIVSDVMLPRKSGIELCREVKTNLVTSHIPLILLTARVSMEDQITGVETGADLYMTKPFNVRLLLTHIRNIFSARQKLFAHIRKSTELQPATVTSNSIDQVFIQRAVDFINNNLLDTQLGVDAIAAEFNMSRVQFYRKVKALTGKTAVEFVRTVRLQAALKLMESRQFTLSEVAYRAGFSSASYFTRSFKEEFGKSPSEYLSVDQRSR